MEGLMMGKEKYKFIESIIYPSFFVFTLWSVKISETIFNISFAHFGILPRHVTGLPGIISAPLIHGDFFHLFSNTLPLIILGIIIVYFYRNIAFHVFFVVYILSDIAVWCMATSKGYHIGSSGLVYGFASFLFFSGIFRHDKRSMVLSLIVVFVYGGLIWGMLPIHEGISWESHFFGSIAGCLCAYIYRKKGVGMSNAPVQSGEEMDGDKNNID
jgi:membrane associated rhomboid family serine protease